MSTVTNQPTIDAINTLCVDFTRLLEERSSVPNRQATNSDITDQTSETNQTNPPGTSSESPLTYQLRAQARMGTINDMFAPGISPDDGMAMVRSVFFSPTI